MENFYCTGCGKTWVSCRTTNEYGGMKMSGFNEDREDVAKPYSNDLKLR